MPTDLDTRVADPLVGADFFGRPVIAVMGNAGSVILTCRSDGDDDEDDVAISLSPTTARRLAAWILNPAQQEPANAHP